VCYFAGTIAAGRYHTFALHCSNMGAVTTVEHPGKRNYRVGTPDPRSAGRWP